MDDSLTGDALVGVMGEAKVEVVDGVSAGLCVSIFIQWLPKLLQCLHIF